MGVRGEGALNDSRVVRTGNCSSFGRHILGTFKVEANIIMHCHEVIYRLSSDPKMLDLK